MLAMGSTGLLAQMQTFTTNGTFTVPAGVTSITVECWGGGGGGGANTSGAKGGGGGGAYTRSAITVTPGQMFAVVIGSGGAPTVNGGNSIFGTNLVLAAGGSTGSETSGGSGGTIGSSIGTFIFNGGTGANASGNTGGGGGGSATASADGGNGSGATGGSGQGAGGTAGPLTMEM